MPWEETEEHIRHRNRNPDEFQKETFRTIVLSEKEGIKAVIGKPNGKHNMEVQSYLFDKSKGWTIQKAKDWFEKHESPSKEHVYAVLPFTISERMLGKPLRIRGVAMTAGLSRNFNIYTPEELKTFADKLVNAPVYLEHVTATDAVGKVAKTDWDGQRLWYEAEVYAAATAFATAVQNSLNISFGTFLALTGVGIAVIVAAAAAMIGFANSMNQATASVQSFNETSADTQSRARSIRRAGEEELYRRGAE